MSKYHPQISAKSAYEHTKIIASFGPRHAATPNEQKAIQYIHDVMKGFSNLETKLEETDPIVNWKENQVTLKIISPLERTLTSHAILGTGSTPPEGITAELEFCGRGFREEYAGKNLAGKIIIHDPPRARTLDNSCAPGMPQRDITYIKSLGVSALIEYCRIPGKWLSAPLLAGREGLDMPCVSISYEDALYLKELLFEWYAMPDGILAQEKIPVKLFLQSSTDRKPGKSFNTVTTFKGGELADEKVILLAHHDNAYGPGAVDNAASVAVVLEVAKALNAINEKCKRTIELVTVSGEEYGQAGSSDYVQRRLSEMKNVKGVIVMDLIGGGDQYYYIEKSVYNGELIHNSAKINKLLEKTCDELGLDIQPTQLEFASDDAPFIEQGVETSYLCRCISKSWPWLHTDLDTADVVDPNALKVVSEICLNALVALANE